MKKRQFIFTLVIMLSFLIIFNLKLNDITGHAVLSPEDMVGNPDDGYGGPSTEESACLYSCVVENNRSEDVCMSECGVEAQPEPEDENEECMQECIVKGCDEYDILCQNANIDSCEFVHTFGLSNTFNWLKYKRPCGHDRIEGINLVADQLWSAYLKSSCQSDTIYLMAIKNK